MEKKDLKPFYTKPVWLTGLLVLAVMFLAACQSASAKIPAPTLASVPTAVAAATATPASAVSEPTISIAMDAKLGKFLVGDKGMTLYVFTKDGPNQSNCTGGCIKNWPALLTLGNPKLGDGVDTTMIGTATLADGTKVVTYNKMPLYYFYKDTKAGDVNGQGVGSVWFVISPDGKLVGNETSAANPAAPIVSEPTISVATDAKLGKILVGDKGMTLYMYTKDEPDKSNCSAGCLKAWPALLTLGSPKLGDGVDASLIGTATLADGSKIVTYNHMPLYYFAKDIKAGDTVGQGVGSVWFVVSPDGKVVGNETSAANPAAPMVSEPTISVVTDAKLGKILVGDKGMTLYIFTKDGPNQSNCAGGCIKAWPPLLTLGSPKLGDGVDASLIGTATLADGTKIVTYNKMPLYYFASDSKAGDVAGQGVGSVWFVISPDGKVVGK